MQDPKPVDMLFARLLISGKAVPDMACALPALRHALSHRVRIRLS